MWPSVFGLFFLAIFKEMSSVSFCWCNHSKCLHDKVWLVWRTTKDGKTCCSFARQSSFYWQGGMWEFSSMVTKPFVLLHVASDVGLRLFQCIKYCTKDTFWKGTEISFCLICLSARIVLLFLYSCCVCPAAGLEGRDWEVRTCCPLSLVIQACHLACGTLTFNPTLGMN